MKPIVDALRRAGTAIEIDAAFQMRAWPKTQD
jgi:hypothetical protein